MHANFLLLLHDYKLRACLAVWLWVRFKKLFVPKCMSMMFFHFLKIIFDISTSKRSKTYKPY